MIKKITLEEVKDIKLMNRIDKKYIINYDQFCSLTKYIVDNFYILSEEDKFLFKYHSIYFDTPNLNMHNDHMNDVGHRQKLRIREYSNGEKFLEIKEKNNSEFTKKKRIPVKSYEINGEMNWIDENLIYDTKHLDKKLDVTFYRLTLISLNKQERITIDFNLTYYNYLTNKSYKENKIIVEVKKMFEENIDFENELNNRNIFQEKYSKYKYGINTTKDV